MAVRIEIDLQTGVRREVEQVGYVDADGGLHYLDAGATPGAGFTKCDQLEFERLVEQSKADQEEQ